MNDTRSVLVLNCGSSSLKYRLISMPDETELAGGEAQRVGPKTDAPPRIIHRASGLEEGTTFVAMPDHETAFVEVMKLIKSDCGVVPDLIGHRIVHGGTHFSGPAWVDERAIELLHQVQKLAPIHNPPATALVEICRRLYPQVPQALVFDTAFHSTIPEYARGYALPRYLREDLGIRKYGFHGTSHEFVATEAARLLGRPLARLNAVSCHLGSGGASLCAIVDGRSVDNTMGFSPLQGLIMSTRSGDLDPAATTRLLAAEWGDIGAVERLLNKRSGVLGLSGSSGDIRDVLASAGADRKGRAGSTVESYLWRLRKYLGSYLAVVGRPHALIFTDTIGETVPEVRWAVCTGMEAFGIEIDDERNRGATSLPADVSTESSTVRILVIQTNEELAIARKSYALYCESTEGVER